MNEQISLNDSIIIIKGQKHERTMSKMRKEIPRGHYAT